MLSAAWTAQPAILILMLLHSTAIYAVLDQQAELDAAYTALRALPNQFATDKPFPAQMPSQQPASSGNKRKREHADEDQRPDISSLQAAVTAFTAWLQTPTQLLYASAQHSSLQQSADPVSTSAAELAAQSAPVLDCVSLAALKQALRPKLRLLGESHSQEASNLFDRLHSNSAGQEVLALAHESPVALPRKSAFMLGDLKDLKFLVRGGLAAELVAAASRCSARSWPAQSCTFKAGSSCRCTD